MTRRTQALAALALLGLAVPAQEASAASPVTRDADRDGRLDAVVLGGKPCVARDLARLDTGARPVVRCAGRRVRARDGARPVLLSVTQAGASLRTTWSEPVTATRRGKLRRVLKVPASRPLAKVAVRDRAGLRALRWQVPAPAAASTSSSTAAVPAPPRPGEIPGRSATAGGPLPDAVEQAVATIVGAAPVDVAEGGEPGVTDPSIAPVAAASAARLHDSIGVNVHLSYFSTAYNDFTKVRQRLGELGATHLRDHACALCALQQQRQQLLAADGARFTLIMANPGSNVGTMEQLVTSVEAKLPGAVAGLESVNEPDMLGLTDWASLTRDHQTALFSRIRRSPVLGQVPVLAPAIVKAGNRSLLGDLTGSVDVGNLHPYPGGRPPGENLPSTLSQAAVNAPGKPSWITETGYHGALATTKGHKPTSERAAARYVPELFLEGFRNGVPRTFLYELVDERPEPTLTDPEQSFGLLRNDFSPKPAFTALRNMIDLIEGAEPGEGALRVAADGTGGAVRTMLLRRADKRFVIALWPTAAIWDPSTRTDVVPPARTVKLRFGQAVASAAVHRPASGADPVAQQSLPGTLDVVVDDEPVLVDVTLP